MATGDIKLMYGTAADATITLASLASSSTLLDGQESTAIDNTSLLAIDYLISGKITTGTSPTAGRMIQVWAVASWDGTTWPGPFDGTDSAETMTDQTKATLCKLVACVSITSTNNTTYEFSGVSLAGVFDGTLPPKFVFFVTQNSGANLRSVSNTHQIRVQPVYESRAV